MAPSGLPAKSPRLFEAICGKIRESIATGALKPGDKLPPERELALQFGVSRAVLREALRSLEIAGLVELYKGAKGGAVILNGGAALARSFSDMILVGRVSLEDLTQARVLIEEVIVRQACLHATEQDFAALEADVVRVATLTKLGLIGARVEDNITFYDLLAEATHNQTLVLISHSLSRIVYQIVREIGPGPLDDLAETRRAFLEPFARRDAAAASKILAAHFLRLQVHLANHDLAQPAKNAHGL